MAVSQAGATQPPVGAAREQLADADWQATVERRMSEAALIVVMLGRTSGLAWEVETLGRLRLWHKVLWVFPPVDVEELERRWAPLAQTLQQHGGPTAELGGAHVGEIVMARGALGRELVAFTSRRRDDWSYEAALQAAVPSVDSAR